MAEAQQNKQRQDQQDPAQQDMSDADRKMNQGDDTRRSDAQQSVPGQQQSDKQGRNM